MRGEYGSRAPCSCGLGAPFPPHPPSEENMKRTTFAILGVMLGAVSLPGGTQTAADKPAAPPVFETKKVEGTDNVYIFRAGNAQSMFVVTSAGVIATDPISYARREAGEMYVQEIRKVTNQPIRYLIYSHHHFDHIAGGKAFKDAGAKIIAHRRAAERLAVLQDPHTPLPDEVVGDGGRVIRMGGTILELSYVGINHSDSTLVFRLPKEEILFVVDLIPVGTFPGRGMIDYHPLEADQSVRKILGMHWTRLIPGHPGPGDRLGSKQDVQDQLDLQQAASDAVKVAAREGKCWDTAEKEVKLPKYESWPNYQQNLLFVVRRYCGLWGRGT